MLDQIFLLYTHLPYHNDTIIKQTQGQRRKKKGRMNKDAGRKTHEDFFRNSLPLTLLQGFERVVQGFACVRVLETEHKLHILTPLL